MYQTIKKFLAEGGKCLLIENGNPVGVVLTMEEYELLRSKSQILNLKSQNEEKSEIKIEEKPTVNPIGEAMIKEIFPDLPAEALAKEGASANFDEINLADADSVNLEDLGLDELPY